MVKKIIFHKNLCATLTFNVKVAQFANTPLSKILDNGSTLTLIEIKGSENITTSFFNGLKQFNELAHSSINVGSRPSAEKFLVYAGEQKQSRKDGTVVPWQQCAQLVDQLS